MYKSEKKEIKNSLSDAKKFTMLTDLIGDEDKVNLCEDEN